MPTTATQIANLALARIGARRILAIDNSSVESRACLLNYEVTRDEVLRAHRWNFAIRRANLSALSEDPAFGWAKQYQLPEDCLRVLQLNGWDYNQDPKRWEVEGRVLLTDISDGVEIKYIYRNANAFEYDPIFVQALSCKLAHAVAKEISGASALAGEQLQEYERVIAPLARRVDSHESRPKVKLPWVESDLVKARQIGNWNAGHDWGEFT